MLPRADPNFIADSLSDVRGANRASDIGRPAGRHYSACTCTVSATRPGPWQTEQASVDGRRNLCLATDDVELPARQIAVWARAAPASLWQVPQVPAVAEFQVSSVRLNWSAPDPVLIAIAPGRAV